MKLISTNLLSLEAIEIEGEMGGVGGREETLRPHVSAVGRMHPNPPVGREGKPSQPHRAQRGGDDQPRI